MRLQPAALATLLLCALPAARAAALGTGGSAPPPVAAIEAAAAGLTGQDATYALHLERARGGNVVGALGTMTYKVDDLCHAWASQQRLEMTLTNSDGTDVKTISDYATWESKDGRQMNFHLRQTTDGAVTAEVDGTAALARLGGAGRHPLHRAPDQGDEAAARHAVPHHPHRHDHRRGRSGPALRRGAAVRRHRPGRRAGHVRARGSWDPPKPDRFAAPRGATQRAGACRLLQPQAECADAGLRGGDALLARAASPTACGWISATS